MKRQVVRPEPHKLSTYFFDQLLHRSPPPFGTSPEEGGREDGVHPNGEGTLPRFSCLRSLASTLETPNTANDGPTLLSSPPPSPAGTKTSSKGVVEASGSRLSSSAGEADDNAKTPCPATKGKPSTECTSVCPPDVPLSPPIPATPEHKAIPDDPLSPYWSLAPVTRHKATDSVLWNAFTPHTYQTELVEFMQQEHQHTRSLAMDLEAQWEKVEALLTRNTARRHSLSPAFEQEEWWQRLRKELQSMPFWTSEDVVQRYALDLTLPSQRESEKKNPHVDHAAPPPSEKERLGSHRSSASSTTANALDTPHHGSFFQKSADSAHIHLQFDMSCGGDARRSTIPTPEKRQRREQRHSAGAADAAVAEREGSTGECSGPSRSSSSSTCSTSGDGSVDETGHASHTTTTTTAPKGMAKAYRIPNDALLNPSKRPRCLRRLFAPLLQKQAQLPKNVTLLLSEVRKCQADMLPSVEALLQDCSMFHIPLHLPFQMIAHCMQRYLTKERSTVAMGSSQAEEKLVEAMREEAPALQHFLHAHGREEETLDRLPTVERHRLAQEMWTKVLASLTRHRHRHDTFLQDFSHLTRTSQTELQRMKDALQECTEASSVAMGQLEQDAKECMEVIRGMTAKTLHTVEEIRREYHSEEDALRASLQQKLYRLQRSEAEQERLARRAREAVKAWMKEQVQYEETAQEVYQERLALAQLQTSYTQLQRSLQTCYEEALASNKRATQIRRMLKKSEKARQFLLTACRQHVGRIETEEYYQRHAVADRCCQNAQSLARLLHDAVSVYEDRFEGVLAKTDRVSWQMQFLLSSERDFVVGNLLDAKEAWQYLEERWKEVKALYKALDLDDDAIPPLLEEAHFTASDAEAWRMCMKHLDGPLNVQRQVPRLREWLGTPESTADRIHAMSDAQVRQLLDRPTPTALPLSSKTKARLMALALSSSSTVEGKEGEASRRPLNAAGIEDDGVAGRSLDARVKQALPSPRPSAATPEGSARWWEVAEKEPIAPHANRRTSANPTRSWSTGEEKAKKSSSSGGTLGKAVPQDDRSMPSHSSGPPPPAVVPTTAVHPTGGIDHDVSRTAATATDHTTTIVRPRQKKCIEEEEKEQEDGHPGKRPTHTTALPIPPSRRVYDVERRSLPSVPRERDRTNSSSRSNSSSSSGSVLESGSSGNFLESSPTALQGKRTQVKAHASGGGEEAHSSSPCDDSHSPFFIDTTRLFSPLQQTVLSSSSVPGGPLKGGLREKAEDMNGTSTPSSVPWTPTASSSLPHMPAAAPLPAPTRTSATLLAGTRPRFQKALPPACSQPSSTAWLKHEKKTSQKGRRRSSGGGGGVGAVGQRKRSPSRPCQDLPRGDPLQIPPTASTAILLAKKTPSPATMQAMLQAKEPRGPSPYSGAAARPLAPLRRTSGTSSSPLQEPDGQKNSLSSSSPHDSHCFRHFGLEEVKKGGAVEQRRGSSSSTQGKGDECSPVRVGKAKREDERPPLTAGLD